MAKRTKSICSAPGCTALVQGGVGKCESCAARSAERDVRQRGTSSSRGYGTRHRKWRTMILARHPVCCRCRTVDRRITPATIADHIIPKSVREDLAFDLENGQGLCAPCHNIKGGFEQKGKYPDWRKR